MPKTCFHRFWQALVRDDAQEVVMERDGERRRADIVGNHGVVIEVQHSWMSHAEVRARERFYGPNMIWLLDMSDCIHRVHFRKRRDKYWSFAFTSPKQLCGFARTAVIWDWGDEEYVFRVKKLHVGPRLKSGGWGVFLPKKRFLRLYFSDVLRESARVKFGLAPPPTAAPSGEPS